MTHKITTNKSDPDQRHLQSLLSAETLELLRLLNASEGNEKHKAMIVGGAVRDALMGRNIHDIDIATILLPQEAMKILKAASIKTYETGIEHGTITAILNERSYEITTLRRDVTTDGRRATVAFTKDWAEDARRRDFTINALYLDSSGRIHDPNGQGLDDIKAQRVRFVGQAEQRIKEDALRILRFIRFWARFEKRHFEPALEPWQTIGQMKDALKTLSKERITQELLMIFTGPRLEEVAQSIHRLGIMAALGLQHDSETKCTDLSSAIKRWQSLFIFPLDGDEKALFQCHAMITFLGGDTVRLSLSNKQQKQVKRCDKVMKNLHEALDGKQLRQVACLHGKEAVMAALCMYGAVQSDVTKVAEHIKMLERWSIPQFPLRGQDFIDAGLFDQNDPRIGEWLKHAKQEWLDSDVSLSKNSLFDSILKKIQSKDQS